jgi:hypothetical protein
MARFLCRIGVHRWLKRNPEVPGFGPGDSAHHTRSGGETYYECERCHKETTSRIAIGGFGIGIGIGIGGIAGDDGGGGDGGGGDGGGDGGGGDGGGFRWRRRQWQRRQWRLKSESL